MIKCRNVLFLKPNNSDASSNAYFINHVNTILLITLTELETIILPLSNSTADNYKLSPSPVYNSGTSISLDIDSLQSLAVPQQYYTILSIFLYLRIINLAGGRFLLLIHPEDSRMPAPDLD